MARARMLVLNSIAGRARRCLHIGTLMLVLPGCSALFGEQGLFPSRANDYLKVEESPPLQWPETYTEPKIVDAYPIPELQFSKVLPGRFEVPRVDPLDELEDKGSVRIQRFRNDEWILVQRAPSQAWPLVLRFLQSNQIGLERADAQQGIIQTGLLSDSRSGTERLESYRIELAAGVQKNTTEIRVKHSLQKRGDEQSVASGQDATRRDNMLRLLAEHLANSPEQSSHSLLAQGLGTASKARLQYTESGNPYLVLELPFERGWASLGLALKKASFEVQDLDRSEGKYFTAYIDRGKREKKPGFFKRLFGGKAKVETQVGGAPLIVTARPVGEGVRIELQRREQPQLQPNEQAFLLRKILHKLS